MIIITTYIIIYFFPLKPQQRGHGVVMKFRNTCCLPSNNPMHSWKLLSITFIIFFIILFQVIIILIALIQISYSNCFEYMMSWVVILYYI